MEDVFWCSDAGATKQHWLVCDRFNMQRCDRRRHWPVASLKIVTCCDRHTPLGNAEMAHHSATHLNAKTFWWRQCDSAELSTSSSLSFDKQKVFIPW